ncbi:tRNA sulfurtransferase [Buchnera aphidicola (Neophyllaphis podocarpi)]
MKKINKILTVTSILKNEIILDIRSEEEREKFPLKIKKQKIKYMSFYNLHKNFKNLDQKKTWLLYCNRGVMSKIQAIYLYELGFKNIKIYKIN